MSDQIISLSRGERVLGPMPEIPLMPATITMMPHHILHPDVRNALLGIHNLRKMAKYAVANLGAGQLTKTEQIAYREDVLGNTPEDTLHFQMGLKAFYKNLRELPDQSTILLTLEPDGICASTCVGRHCMRPRSDDLEAIEQTTFLLEHSEFRQEEDWDRLAPTAHTVYDVSEVGLSTPTVAIPQVIEFPELVIRAGVLRRVI